MNTFFTVMYFALVATAAAKTGYNYQPGRPVIKQTFRPSASVSSGGIYSAQQAPPLPSFSAEPLKQSFVPLASGSNYAQQQQFAAPVQTFAASGPQYTGPAAPQFVAPAPQYVAPVQQQSVYTPAVSSSNFNYQPQQQQQQVIVNKDIYIHSAPEEFEEIGSERGPADLAPIRKNYRIVFIKAPTQNLKLNLDALKRTQAANEEKTIIYVLSKKPDIANIQNQLSAVHTEQKSQKPEVFFIKYKTQDEANRAQQEIQAQYDSLGGSTHISDEGIAPITSVIGGGPVNVGSLGSGSFGGSSVGGGNSFTTGGSLGGNSFSSGGSFGGNSFTSGSSLGGGNSFTSGSSLGGGNSFSTGGSNFVQSSSSYQSSQGSSSGASFVAEPSVKYLPIVKKK